MIIYEHPQTSDRRTCLNLCAMKAVNTVHVFGTLCLPTIWPPCNHHVPLNLSVPILLSASWDNLPICSFSSHLIIVYHFLNVFVQSDSHTFLSPILTAAL